MATVLAPLGRVGKRYESVPLRRGRLSSRIEALDNISRHFIWTVGIQVGVLLALVAALAGR